MTSEDATHSVFRNVLSKFTSHTAQKPSKPQGNNEQLVDIEQNLQNYAVTSRLNISR
jgi:hypothetical protein